MAFWTITRPPKKRELSRLSELKLTWRLVLDLIAIQAKISSVFTWLCWRWITRVFTTWWSCRRVPIWRECITSHELIMNFWRSWMKALSFWVVARAVKLAWRWKKMIMIALVILPNGISRFWGIVIIWSYRTTGTRSRIHTGMCRRRSTRAWLSFQKSLILKWWWLVMVTIWRTNIKTRTRFCFVLGRDRISVMKSEWAWRILSFTWQIRAILLITGARNFLKLFATRKK